MLFIRLTEERGKLYAQLNAKGSKVILTSISENGKDYEISYSSVFGAFSPLFTIDEYFNGYKFDFFPSNLVYLTFDIVGVSSPSEISFSEIGGNKLVSFYNSNGEVEIYEDYGTPTIVREKSIHDLTLTYGSVVSVPKISALSIFSGFTWAEITVVSPSGKVLLSKANAYNDNDIVLEEYGEDSVSSTVKTGDKIRIPELNVTGMEEDFVTNIYLIAPDFTMNEVETGEKISFTKQGIYKLVVIVSDEFNTCSKVFKVVVEG